MVLFVLGALISLVVVALLLLVFYMFSNERFIEISGVGIVKRQPNEASVIIGLRTDRVRDTEIAPALESNAEQFARIVREIRRVVPTIDVETRTYTISPNDANRFDNMYSIYNSATVQIRNELNLMSDVIRIAVENGANSVSNVEYSLSMSELEKARIASEDLALANARKQAEHHANNNGLTITSTEQIIKESMPNQARSFSVRFRDIQENLLFVPYDIDIISKITVRYRLQ